MSRLGTLCFLLASIAGCGPRSASAPFLPPARELPQASGSGRLVLRVTVSRGRVHPAYISASTKGMSVKISGPTHMNKSFGLTVGASGCYSTRMTLGCDLDVSLKSCPSPKNCYSASVITYDAFNPATHTIPPTAHALSAEVSFSFRIGKSRKVVPLVLEGVPAAIAFLPSTNSSLTGSQKSGFIEPKCDASTQTITVLGIDAAGNYIVGAGAPSSSLSSDDSAQLASDKTSNSTQFDLVPPASPAYAFGNHTVHLTATVVPGSKSGGAAKIATVDVSYSGDICGKISEFALPGANSEPFGIVTGPDKALWITERGANKIAKMTTGGTLTEFGGATSPTYPAGIIVGPDRNLWFTEDTADKIGRITTAGTISEFEVFSAGAKPEHLAAGSDGNIWYTELNANKIGVMSTAGTPLHEYPTLTSNSHPFGIAAGPDGALWFTESNAAQIGRITTGGTQTEYSTPTVSSGPFGIAVGSGSFWFAEQEGNKVAQVTTAGTVTSEYPVPTTNSEPNEVVVGPDGAIWFTEFNGSKIGRLAPGGSFTEYPIPTGLSLPAGIAAGPDGAIWFVEENGNKVGRLR